MKNEEIETGFNRPIKKWRTGSIEAAVWLNKRKKETGEEIEFKTVSLRRAWRQDGVWRDSIINLRRNDIPKVQLVLNEALKELLLTDDKEGD